ncbi:exostosin-like 3 [Acanthaster planci]|uniref:Exostosin-like 3 n=1 Tax=Acanthaster planci TaxID=133434 RepID=A0A8B7YEY8_ACAPL|nr:exostosin-like 3 [Acanthaster planci]XP_022091152.1 exostosin-like 3 [Acanthaster planci]
MQTMGVLRKGFASRKLYSFVLVVVVVFYLLVWHNGGWIVNRTRLAQSIRDGADVQDFTVCSSALDSTSPTSRRDEADLQMKLHQCARYISKLLTESEGIRSAVQEVDSFSKLQPWIQGNTCQNEVRQRFENGTHGGHPTNECRLSNCFDYSRCPLNSDFSVYLYQGLGKLSNGIEKVMTVNPYYTSDQNTACVFLVLVEGSSGNGLSPTKSVGASFSKLPSWKGTGQNHVLLNLARNVSSHNVLQTVSSSHAIVAQSNFEVSQFRPGFDIVTPMLLGTDATFDWHGTPRLTPAKRKYLLSFQGVQLPHRTSPFRDSIHDAIQSLKTVYRNQVYIDLSCPQILADRDFVYPSEWWMCDNNEKRAEILRQSTFALIIAPTDRILSSTMLQARLHEALRQNVVPVVLGEQVRLPFADFIAWEKAVIILPKARAKEMIHYLSSIHESDILALRRQGWFLWTTYLSSTEAVMNGILATLRTRLSLPPRPIPATPSQGLTRIDVGPTQKRSSSSTKYLRNSSYLSWAREPSWNSFPGPYHLYPSTPLEPVLPSDVYFEQAGKTFEPISKGTRKTGEAFRKSLGGNSPIEQFTVIIMTYDREPQLITLLSRLQGLPYMNKVLIVWNHPKPPSSYAKWPKQRVPMQIILQAKNSMNNRFLPFDEIETDAILFLDDDVHRLTHDEIDLAFRVWRENRDQIVGFPGRNHAMDVNNENFRYDAEKSCEVSMVLPQAAFLHKYYNYVYSYVMPQAIRDHVDKTMNCDDIALNFLVSFVSRKPPIKVGGHSDFPCVNCKSAISAHKSHYTKRTQCVRYFGEILGYTPLLYTQYQANSIMYGQGNKEPTCYKEV